MVLSIWRPEFSDALELVPHDLSVYHVDDEYSFSAREVGVSAVERHLLESAGQVFIHSPALIAKRGGFNRNTKFLPNGVDYSSFATPLPEPEDLQTVPHPRIGYVGYLKRMLDWSLLLELSAVHADWSFVFVGPASPHPEITGILEKMAKRANVYLLGGKSATSLGAYPQHFDACVMPYRIDDYTKYIYPLKLHEYLAAGKPVISSPIRSVEEFRDVVAIANSTDEWSNAIERAISPAENTPARCAERQKIACEHDWRTLVAEIACTIATRLRLNRADPLPATDSALFNRDVKLGTWVR